MEQGIPIDTGALYNTRLLVFMEAEPQSNKYYQVHLTKEEFKRFSMSIGTVIEEENERGKQTVKLELSEKSYMLPDLQEVNEEEKIIS